MDDPLLGRTLAGRYRLIARLGSGGASAVYLARHVLIERLSAIKILQLEEPTEAVQREQFVREARAVNRINHPNIVEISDYGEASVSFGARGRQPLVFLVMEYVPGETFRTVLARGPIDLARLVPIAAQVASALARAHQMGVVHRDVKPGSILLVPRRDGGDLVKLTDFGLAKIEAAGRSGGEGHLVGTPGYVAPEYLVGDPVDGRADLYALGVVLYQALAGAFPIDASNEVELLTRVLASAPVPLSMRLASSSELSIPPAIDSLIMRCLARDPAGRPQDAHRFLDELREAAAGIASIDGLLRPGAPVEVVAPAIEDPWEDEPPSSMHTPSVPPPPRIGSVDAAALLASWRSHWDALEVRLETHKAAWPTLGRGRDVLDALARATESVARTQKARDDLEATAREFRTTLGYAIDTLARELSAAHARVVALSHERDQLAILSEAAPHLVDAGSVSFERSALGEALREARRARDDLGHQVGTLQDELHRRDLGHEAELTRITATLEGEAAAIATLHRELELASAELAPMR